MNKKSYLLAKRFYRKYGPAEKVLEVGSLNCNGTIRRLFENYVGTDKTDGPNVDVVCTDVLPFPVNSFDMVVTTDCLEHDSKFWNTFNEMVRVCKTKGYIYIKVPTTTQYHPCHGGDYWRFQKDCWDAFTDFNTDVILIEKWYGKRRGDNLGVFQKK